MSKSIDEKVVEMKFDNKHFESNVSTTLSTLDKLKKSLNFKGTSKGLEEVNAAAKNCDLSPLSKGLETVQTKFSAMQVIGVTALANITNSAVEAGKRIISALTIDPVKTGFQEYETQINAVQTILANTQSKGTTLNDVNAALDTLNTYADKTIYNFTEMTRNIGTFTAAGITLDTSVNAIQGIANLAAVSGSNAQQASTAMYQLSQALASGTVKLMDWNSVVNAGMGGQVFQDALKETARIHGVAIDQMITDEGSFRETLQKGWLTSEILTETLQKFTLTTDGLTEAQIEQNREMLRAKGYTEDQINQIFELGKMSTDAATKVKTLTQLWDTLKEAAQSGWTQTWEIIVGDFDQAKALFTNISDVVGGIINAASEARNAFLGGALSESPWTKLSAQVQETGISIDDFQNGLMETARAHGIAIDDMVEANGSFVGSLKEGWLSADIITETLANFVDGSSEFAKSTEKMSDKLEYFQDVVDRVWYGEFYNGEDRVNALAEAGYNYAEVQDLVNKTVDGHRLVLEDLSEEQLKSVGYTEEQIASLNELKIQAEQTGTPLNKLIQDMSKPTGRELLIDSFKNILESIGKILTTIKEAWDKIFGDFFTSEDLYNIIDQFHSWTESIQVTDETIQNISTTLEGFFTALKLAATFSNGFFQVFFKIAGTLQKVFGLDFWGLTAKVGSLMIEFYDWLYKDNAIMSAIIDTGNNLLSTIEQNVTAFRNWIGELAKLPIVQENFENLKTAFFDTWSNIKTWFCDWINLIKEFAENIKNLDSFSLENVGAAFATFGGKVFEHIKKLGGVFSTFAGAIQKFAGDIFGFFTGMGEGVAPIFEGIGSGIGWIVDKIKVFIDQIGVAEVAAVGIGIVLILIIKKILSVLPTVVGFMEGWGKIAKAFSNVGTGLKNMFTDMGKAKLIEARSVAIRNLAISIGILAASLYILAQLDWEQIGKGLVAIAGLAVIIGGLAFVMSKIGTTEMSVKFIGLGTMLVGFAVSLLILVNVLKQMEGLDKNKLVLNLWTLAIMIAGLIAASAALSKVAPSMASSTIGLLGIVISLKLMVGVLKDLGEIEPEKAILGLLSLIGMVTALSVLVSICSKLTSKSMTQTAIGMLAVAIGLKVMVGVIDDIANLDSDKLLESISNFVIVFGSIAVLMIASKFAGKYAIRAGASIIAISGALLLIVAAIKMMAAISEEDLDKASSVIAKILLVFGAVVALSFFAGKNAVKAGAMILLMSGALIVLSAALVIMSHIDPQGLERGVKSISILMAMFAIVVAASGFAKECEKTVAMMAVSIATMAIALGILASIDKDKLQNATLSLASVMAVFALMVAALQFIDTEHKESMAKIMGSLITMVAVIGILAGIILMLSGIEPERAVGASTALGILLLSLSGSLILVNKFHEMKLAAMAKTLGILIIVVGLLSVMIVGLAKHIDNVDSAIGAAVAISILLATMSASMLLLGKFKITNVKSMLGTLGILTGVVAALAAILLILEKCEVKPSIETAISLSVLLLAFTTVTGILSIIGPTAGMAAKGAAALIVVVGIIGAFIAAVGFLVTSFPELKNFISEGIPLLLEVAHGIGSFIGNIISGFIEGATNLPDMATRLSTFMENLQPFIDKCNSIESSTFDGLSSLVGAIFMLTASELLDAISKIVSGGKSSFESLGEQLVPFGEAMVMFSDTVKGRIDQGAVEAAAAASNVMVALAKDIPTEGGLLGMIMGENNLFDNFGDQLIPFGKAMVIFSETVAGKIDQGAVETAAAAANVMVALAKDIPTEGGLLGMIMGENNLFDNFANQLVPFGTAMVRFSSVVSGNIDMGAVEAAAAAGNIMIELAKEIPQSGGILDWILGGNDLKDFGNQLVPFGTAITRFSGIVSGNIDTGAVEATATAGNIMIELAKEIPQSGGILDFFFGGKDFTAFGEQIVKFGEAMVKFSETIQKCNVGDVSSLVATTDTLVDIANSLSENNLDFSSLKESLSTLSEAFISFSESVTDKVDIRAVGILSEAGKDLADMAAIMPDEVDLAPIANGLTTFGDAMVDFSEVVSGNVDADAIKIASDSGKQIVDMTAGIPTELNIVAFSSGIDLLSTSLVDFSTKSSEINKENVDKATSSGEKINTFISGIPQYVDTADFISNSGNLATALKDFSDKSADVNEENVSRATTAGLRINGFINGIPQYVDTEDFRTNAGNLATSLKDFSDKSAEINSENVSVATDAGYKINDFIKGIPQIWDVTSFTTNLPAISTAIINFMNDMAGVTVPDLSGIQAAIDNVIIIASTGGSSAIGAFAEGINSGSTSATSAFTNVMTSIDTSIANSAVSMQVGGTKLVTYLSTGIAAQSDSAIQAFKTILDSAFAAIQSSLPKFLRSGISLMTNFKDGLKTGGEGASDSILSTLRSCVTSMEGFYQSFYEAGEYLGDGLIAGIAAKEQAVKDAGYRLGEKAVEGENAGQQSNSPSKATIKAGKYLGEGLIIGIDKMNNSVYKKSKEMGGIATSGISNAMKAMSNFDISESSPTIRPVVDLSSVYSAQNNMKLGANVSANLVSGPVDSMSRIITKAQYDINSSNMEVINAVNGLREDLNNLYADNDQEIGLYVDGVRLASSIAKPMNRQLNILSRRGV